MRQYKRGSKEVEFLDSEFVETLYKGNSGNRSSDRQAKRKTQQFCRQVLRDLNLALAESNAIDNLSGLFVDDVTPAPDCGRLLVHVLIPADCSVVDAMSAIRREASHLRAEVAKAITRKRAPELIFAPAFQEGGPDA